MGFHRQSAGSSSGFSSGSDKSLGHRPLQTKAPIGGPSRTAREHTGRSWASYAATPPPTAAEPARRLDGRQQQRILGGVFTAPRWNPRGLLRKGKETLDKWRREGIPTTISNQIQYRANRLVRAHRLSPSQVDDIAGDFMLSLWKAFARFKEGTASVYTYSRGVLDREYKAKKRKIMNSVRSGCRPGPLSKEVHHRLGEQGACPVEHRELAETLNAQIESLPEDLRDLAERLKVQSPGEIARDLGVHRGTVHRRIERLREHVTNPV